MHMETLSFLYLVCFGVGLLFTIVSAFGADVFGGHDAHVDLGTGSHAEAGFGYHEMPGFSPLSPTTLATFVTAFGGLGLVFSRIEATRGVWVSAPLAVLGGLLIAVMVFVLFREVFRHTQSSSEGKVLELVGEIATVITPIPANGVGEIAYVQTGSRYSAPAREESGATVGMGKTVVITRVVGTQFFVSLVA
jgi:membrane protein implicated in regulation of membrane protease activity